MQIDTQSALLKKEQVCKAIGISSRTLENLVRDGDFPPGVRLGKWCFWSEKVVRGWVQRQFATQESWSP